MKQFLLCELRGALQLVRADDATDAKAVAEPAFESEQPDQVFDVTDILVTEASNLIALARECVGSGAESRFRYDVNTLVGIWRGEAPPDVWQERYAKEWQRAQQLEAEVARLQDRLAGKPA